MSSEKKPVSKLARFFGLGNSNEKANDADDLQSNESQQSQQLEPSDEIAEQQIHQETNSEGQEKSETDSGPDSSKIATFEKDSAETQSSKKDNPRKDKQGLFARWRSGLGKTRQGLGSAFGSLLGGRQKIDEDLIEELETVLLTADVGIDTTNYLIDEFRAKAKKGIPADQDLMQVFQTLLVKLLEESAQPLHITDRQPNVVMMVGVNGVGKTTSIGKLAKRLQQQGKTLMLAAGDTFRAAAVEQLQVWGERNQIPVVAQSTGSDSASVIYDALHSAQAKNTDVLIADTAGRLHNKSNLMEELGKIVRVLKKLDETAPHEILLVLDAATGQNALSQAREFCKTVPVTGLILTKLDGTAKGGVIFSLVQQLGLPVKFVGLGEGIDDLTEFNSEQFVNALFSSDTE